MQKETTIVSNRYDNSQEKKAGCEVIRSRSILV